MWNSLGFVGVTVLLVLGCAGVSEKEAALEEVRAEIEAEDAELSTSNSSLVKLTELLSSLGYQGVGLQYETEATLERLTKIFSNPVAKDRRIKLVYTGMNLQYDDRYQSLTIPAESDIEKITVFIAQKVPPQKK